MDSNAKAQLDLVTAPGDGVNPAVLLTTKGVLKAQYLFHVPEGFSRFALEHKIKPGVGLRALFVQELADSNGLAGLIMRLKGQGHGSFELIGPRGTLEYARGLKSVCRWKNPALLTIEADATRPSACMYQDDCVSVLPFLEEDANSRPEKRAKTNVLQQLSQENPFSDKSFILSQLSCLSPAVGASSHSLFGRVYSRCTTDPEISLWSGQAPNSHRNPVAPECASNRILGYLCHVRSTDSILVIATLQDEQSLQSLLSHSLYRELKMTDHAKSRYHDTRV